MLLLFDKKWKCWTGSTCSSESGWPAHRKSLQDKICCFIIVSTHQQILFKSKFLSAESAAWPVGSNTSGLRLISNQIDLFYLIYFLFYTIHWFTDHYLTSVFKVSCLIKTFQCKRTSERLIQLRICETETCSRFSDQLWQPSLISSISKCC